MTREEWEYWAQDMKVRTAKLPDGDERKAVLQLMMRNFEEWFALYDEIEEFDPDDSLGFISKLFDIWDEAAAILNGKPPPRVVPLH